MPGPEEVDARTAPERVAGRALLDMPDTASASRGVLAFWKRKDGRTEVDLQIQETTVHDVGHLLVGETVGLLLGAGLDPIEVLTAIKHFTLEELERVYIDNGIKELTGDEN